MTPCCICLEEFLDWKVNNPRYCCSAQLCQSCAREVHDCPQCRYKADWDLLNDEVSYLQTSSFRCYTTSLTPTLDASEGRLCLEWSKDGVLDRTDGPARICYYESGKIHTETYYKDGVYHRTDGPAYRLYTESGKIQTELYCKDGMWHRTDGPAYINYYASVGKCQTEQYYKDGKLGRTDDGPPCIYYYDAGKSAKIWYDELGQIQKECHYKDGILVSVSL